MTGQNSNKWYAFAPNLLTVLNLLCGTSGIYFALEDNFGIALSLLLIGALFDFSDGLVARVLKVSSELGKQLDSLADLVTFGVLPKAMVFSLQQTLLIDEAGTFSNLSPLHRVFILSPLLITAFSALRLAKFNIDTRQSSSFIGLPTPANALFFASLCYVIASNSSSISNFSAIPFLLFILCVVFSFLLISPLPMFSLKFSNLKLKSNLTRYFFLLISIILLFILRINAIPLIILLYISMSVITAGKRITS
jgi:CDP-diacylglycerol--serine O-phosphatidyltransferase